MSVPAELLSEVMTDQGLIKTDRLAEVLHITKRKLAGRLKNQSIFGTDCKKNRHGSIPFVWRVRQCAERL